MSQRRSAIVLEAGVERMSLVVSAFAIENGPGPQVGSSDSSGSCDELARRPARRGAASRCRACGARRPCTAGRRGRAPRARCAAPPPGSRRTSCPCARTRSRSCSLELASPGRRRPRSATFATPACSASARAASMKRSRRRRRAPRRRRRPARRSAGSCRRSRSRCRARARPVAGVEAKRLLAVRAEPGRDDVPELDEAVEQDAVPGLDRPPRWLKQPFPRPDGSPFYMALRTCGCRSSLPMVGFAHSECGTCRGRVYVPRQVDRTHQERVAAGPADVSEQGGRGAGCERRGCAPRRSACGAHGVGGAAWLSVLLARTRTSCSHR